MKNIKYRVTVNQTGKSMRGVKCPYQPGPCHIIGNRERKHCYHSKGEIQEAESGTRAVAARNWAKIDDALEVHGWDFTTFVNFVLGMVEYAPEETIPKIMDMPSPALIELVAKNIQWEKKK